MPHSFVRVFIHFGWSTKYFQRVFSDQERSLVQQHIEEYAVENGIHVICLNVQPEHVHALVSLGRSHRPEDVSKALKGESSHWINQSGLLRYHFSWQRGYWAESVSPQDVPVVERYIQNQDQHHRRRRFLDEYTEWLASQGFTREEIGEVMKEGSR